MRRSSGPSRLSIHRAMVQADYISSHVVGGGLIASIAIIAGIHALGVVALGASDIDSFTGMLFVSGILYAILASLTVTSMADDLGQGYASLYLAHPLSRAEYFLAWMAAGPLIVVIAYLLSIAAPLLALDPSSLLQAPIYLALLAMLGQVAFHTSIAIYSSVVLRNKTKATLTVLMVMIIAPVLTVFLGSLAASAMHAWDFMETVVKLIGVFHPALLYLPFARLGESAAPSLIYGFGASLLLYYMGYRTFRDKTDL